MDKILVLDFGGQYAHLIARRFRNLGFYSEIALPSVDVNQIKDTKGIVMSGGPSSVYEKDAPEFNSEILKLDIPILGLCYGHQLLLKEYKGTVEKAKIGEFGYTLLNMVKKSPLFKSVKFPTQVWMSHSDSVTAIPDGFEVIGSTKDCKYAALQNLELKRFSLQFHAEVKDTLAGNNFFKNFAKFCGMKKNWDSKQVISAISARIKSEVKDRNVLLFLSGGVDSSVAYALLKKVLGTDRVLGLYINNGFMRKNETEAIQKRYKKAGFKNVLYEDCESVFLGNVGNQTDPQKKREIIGDTFLKVRDRLVKEQSLDENKWLLAQGTLYPDIIESGCSKHAEVIKTHHNRVEGIKQLLEKGLVVEPLKDLYKDEVRLIGKKLGLHNEVINRHPFPGPGISINLLCSDGQIPDPKEYKKANDILSDFKLGEYLLDGTYKLSALPVRSVGVQGDFRTYTYPALLDSGDIYDKFAGWDKLESISSFITNNVSQINRVIFKIFQKKECSIIEAYCKKERLDMIREVDHIVLDELKKAGWYNKVFQHLTINLPYASSKKSCSIVLRPVFSEDVMTARFAHLKLSILRKITERIEELEFVDALYYDITNKPPATFGWE